MLIKCTNSIETSGLQYRGVLFPLQHELNFYSFNTGENINHRSFQFTNKNICKRYLDTLSKSNDRYLICIAKINDFNQITYLREIVEKFYPSSKINFFTGYFYFIYDNKYNRIVTVKSGSGEFTDNYDEQNNFVEIPTYFLLCSEVGFPYLEEYISSLKNYLNPIIEVTNDTTTYNFVEDSLKIYVFISIGNFTAPDKKFRRIILNTEQLTRNNWFNNINSVSGDASIADHSIENIKILKHTSMYIPYQYDEVEVSILKNYYQTTPKTYDIAFCGALSTYRKNILDNLRDLGYRVLIVEGWKDKRDRQIASCRLLLNIHFDKTFNVYESIRCDRWAFAGMPIISQDSIHTDLLDVSRYSLVKFVKYDNLVKAVHTHLTQNQNIVTPLDITPVIEERKNHILKFMQINADFKIKILLFGGRGWIGSHLCDLLSKRPEFEICHAESRADDEKAVEEEILKINPDRIVCLIGRTSGTGFTTIDYLEQKGKINENIRDNLYGPMVLAILSTKYKLHLTYMGTGCIFNGYPEKGYSEEDKPDFFNSNYSVVKGYTDRLMHFMNSNVLNLRIRMPITSDNHPKNFIKKMMTYEKICSIPNSMSVLPNLLPIMVDMIRRKTTGTMNFTNPGLITHNEILEMVKEIIDPNFTWKNFTKEEQAEILLGGRSNDYLDTTKIESLYPDILPIGEAIRKAMIDMKQNLPKK